MASTSSSLKLCTDHGSPQPQSSLTHSIHLPSRRVEFQPFQLVDDGRSDQEFLSDIVDSYISPSFIKVHKLSSSQVDDPREFFEQCLMKLHQNDSAMLSLVINCQKIEEHEMARFTEALAVNSILLELSIFFQQLTEDVATNFVEALKLNSTLTRLNLRNNHVNDAAATQLSQLLRFNTTLLSLDLSNTRLTENGISQLTATLCVNTALVHLDLRWNEMNAAATTQLCKVLAVNSILTVLDLRKCELNETGVILLSEALAGNPSLTRLEISQELKISWFIKEILLQRLFYNRLQRIHLPRLFQNDPTLTSLKLSSQRINGIGATRLSEALAVNSVLTTLNLNDNKIDDQGMTSLSQALPSVCEHLDAVEGLIPTKIHTPSEAARGGGWGVNHVQIRGGPVLDSVPLQWLTQSPS